MNFLRTAASIVNRLCVSDILLYLKLLMLLNTLMAKSFICNTKKKAQKSKNKKHSEAHVHWRTFYSDGVRNWGESRVFPWRWSLFSTHDLAKQGQMNHYMITTTINLHKMLQKIFVRIEWIKLTMKSSIYCISKTNKTLPHTVTQTQCFKMLWSILMVIKY